MNNTKNCFNCKHFYARDNRNFCKNDWVKLQIAIGDSSNQTTDFEIPSAMLKKECCVWEAKNNPDYEVK